MASAKSEFRNDSGGVCGAVVIENGKPRGIAVKPGDSIWLSEEEQIATANAPKRDADNPFTNGTLVLATKAQEIANRRPIGDSGDTPQVPQSEEQEAEAAKRKAKQQADVAARKKAEEERLAKARKQAEQPATPVEETGATIAPSGKPTHGKRQGGEEVGTPEAVPAGE